MDEVKNIFSKIEHLPKGLTNENRYERLCDGYSLLTQLRECNVSEKTAYDMLKEIYLTFDSQEFEYDFMADLMDFIVGFCRKDLHIWRQRNNKLRMCINTQNGENMLKERLENVKIKTPLVHNITNYVTVNDCANIILACKASPIMSDDIEEVEEITSICTSLNINIGTLNQQTIPSMFAAGKKANECGHPVVLDPVGAGASALRTKTAHKLLEEINFAVIKGNSSEIKTLALGEGTTKGVDADIADTITGETLEEAIVFAKAFSKKTGAVIVITGAIDIVADDKTAYIIKNGHPMMSQITGAGCMLSAMLASYLGANEDNYLEAAAACVCAMGLCGELAYEWISITDGNSSYRNYIIDMVYNLTGEALLKGANYEMR